MSCCARPVTGSTCNPSRPYIIASMTLHPGHSASKKDCSSIAMRHQWRSAAVAIATAVTLAAAGRFWAAPPTTSTAWRKPAVAPSGRGQVVAIVGGGPAGMTAALFAVLARRGHKVSIYESQDGLGGLWASRLDKDGYYRGDNSCKVYQQTYHTAPALFELIGTVRPNSNRCACCTSTSFSFLSFPALAIIFLVPDRRTPENTPSGQRRLRGRRTSGRSVVARSHVSIFLLIFLPSDRS